MSAPTPNPEPNVWSHYLCIISIRLWLQPSQFRQLWLRFIRNLMNPIPQSSLRSDLNKLCTSVFHRMQTLSCYSINKLFIFGSVNTCKTRVTPQPDLTPTHRSVQLWCSLSEKDLFVSRKDEVSCIHSRIRIRHRGSCLLILHRLLGAINRTDDPLAP